MPQTADPAAERQAESAEDEVPPRAMRLRSRRVPQRIWNPPAHWRLLGFCLLVLLVVIGFQGFATHTIGSTSEPAGSQVAPLAGKPPVLVARGDRLIGAEPPPGRRIALTFDDGPSPQWTLRIAAELRRAGVAATFFEIGSQAARYPNIVKTLVHDGDEIGNHTFTHVPLSAVPAWEGRMQISLTEA
ncbi:MAG TPA: polysaccharide deacetylase family protein, partial [Solirubrobacteraceae bacterium]|nr:polysaccharide deacetylase family protein [Solirubrobacteraceae bacterium]